MGTVQKSYRTDYNEMLTKINNAFIQLDDELESGIITKEQYNEDKYQLSKDYSTTLENKHIEDMLYNSIANENDKELYAASAAFLSGDLNACGGAANLVNAIYNTSPGVFDSFTESPKPVQNRTFTMGEAYYNGVIRVAENKGIDFNKLGIKCNRDNEEFTVPKDPKAILQFAECYAIAGGYEANNGFWEGIYATLGDIFSDTANNFFNGDTRMTDHEFLVSLGETYNQARNNITRIEKDNGITPYYIPIMSPGVSDITRMQQYVFGDNTSEINLIDDNLFDRLKIADFYSYKIYANNEDVIAENGGNGALSETNNPKTIDELSKLIKNAKKEDVTFAFATCGYEYGTMITVNKNDRSVKCFISALFPSTQAEEYVKSPMFKAKAFLDIVKARDGGTTIPYRNHLGAHYSGNFHASNNRLYYKIDGDDRDGYPYIDDPTALALRMYTLMFEQMCLNKQHLSNVSNAELPNENDVLKFITQKDENGDSIADVSLVSILSAITGDSEQLIVDRLMKHYNNYYK